MRRADEPRPDEYRRAAELREELRRFLRVSERAARGNRLTPQRYSLLLMIKGAPDGSEQSTVTALSERLQLAQSTVTELVKRAEEAGLIHREPSPRDGRVVFLGLTMEGERRLAATVRELGPERKRLEALFAAPGGRQRRS